MSIITLTAYMAVGEHIVVPSYLLNDTIEDICSNCSAIKFIFPWIGNFYPLIEVVDNTSDEPDVLTNWLSSVTSSTDRLVSIASRTNKSMDILKVSINVDSSDLEKIKIDPNELDVERGLTAEYAQMELLKSLFERRIYDLVFAANIARVGSMNLFGGIIIRDGNIVTNLEEMNAVDLMQASEHASSIKWPKIQSLPFLDVWNWLLHHQGFLDGFGGGRISRSLNAFTHIFGYPTPGDLQSLFWAVMGIEAIYVKGSESIFAQGKEKIWTLLGKQESFKDAIRKMYSFRSNYIHGASDIEGRVPIIYNERITDQAIDLCVSRDLAVAILVATFQELVCRGWHDISFRYVASETEEA